MNTEAFVQGVVIFLICVTFTNIVINFMLLCFETLKECSIMDGENQKKRRLFFNEGKRKNTPCLSQPIKLTDGKAVQKN